MRTPLKSLAKAALTRPLPILLILIIGAIGVQTITSCSSDEGGGGDPSSSSRGGGNSSPSASISYCDTVAYAMLTPCEDGIVEIGDQVWQKCNLNVEPSVGDHRCYCNKPESCEIYGRLYNWATAMALPSYCNSETCADQINEPYHQGICPSGWHIPTKEEWEALKAYIESSKGCTKCDAKHLKSASGWNSSGNGLDSYGFAALPGGTGYFNVYLGDSFYSVGNIGHWWSARSNTSGAYVSGMNYQYEYVHGLETIKGYLLSVRCIKD